MSGWMGGQIEVEVAVGTRHSLLVSESSSLCRNIRYLQAAEECPAESFSKEPAV